MTIELHPSVGLGVHRPEWEDTVAIMRNGRPVLGLTYEELFQLRAAIDNLNVLLVEALMRHG